MAWAHINKVILKFENYALYVQPEGLIMKSTDLYVSIIKLEGQMEKMTKGIRFPVVILSCCLHEAIESFLDPSLGLGGRAMPEDKAPGVLL
jgi:hypothetical protein